MQRSKQDLVCATLAVALLTCSACGGASTQAADLIDFASAPTDLSATDAANETIEAGQPCAPAPEGSLVCAYYDGRFQQEVLFCNQGTWKHAFQCPGLEKCMTHLDVDEVTCGSADVYAMTGAPCASDAEAACSFDSSNVLWCQNGRWVDAIHCAPSSCFVDTTKNVVQCANQGESVGDLCKFPAGKVICSTDLSKILECSNGITTVYRDCGSLHCVSTVNGYACQ